MTSDCPGWVAAAKSLPVAFAQVREDPALDFWVLDQIGHGSRIALVASGGCTVAALAARTDVESIHFVDPNLAQIALTRLKLHLLSNFTPADRLSLLGHSNLDATVRHAQLAEMLRCLALSPDVLGPLEEVAACGPDFAGRYERLFQALRQELSEFSQPLEDLLCLSDIQEQEQARRVKPETRLGQALDLAFANVMAQANLEELFGEGATRNPRESFATHFTGRLRWILETQPAAGNPFLSQLLLGHFAPGAEHCWLRLPIPQSVPAISWDALPMVTALRQRCEQFDLVHLSNILDWLDPGEARMTLRCARSALRPGGWVIVRQLNSVLDIHALCADFTWFDEVGTALLTRDRSFFYRAVHVGRRK